MKWTLPSVDAAAGVAVAVGAAAAAAAEDCAPTMAAGEGAPPVASNCRRRPLDPVVLTKAATGALEGRIVDGVPYARAGVMLTDLSPAGAAPQLPMFSTSHKEKHIGPPARRRPGPVGVRIHRPRRRRARRRTGLVHETQGPVPAVHHRMSGAGGRQSLLTYLV